MKKTIVFVAALLSASFALAADKVAPLDDAKCQASWSMASPNGAAISKDKAVPFIVDFTMVDTDNDATIDAKEFATGCKEGWVKGQ